MYTLNSTFSKLCYVPVLPTSVDGAFILLVAQARSWGILVITIMSLFPSKMYMVCTAGLENERYHEPIYSSSDSTAINQVQTTIASPLVNFRFSVG